MTTAKEDNAFAALMQSETETTIIGSALDSAIDWIGSNLDPSQVFNEKTLTTWAEQNGFSPRE